MRRKMRQNLSSPDGEPGSVTHRQDDNGSELCELVRSHLFFQCNDKSIKHLHGPTACEFNLEQDFKKLNDMAVVHAQQVLSLVTESGPTAARFFLRCKVLRQSSGVMGGKSMGGSGGRQLSIMVRMESQ